MKGRFVLAYITVSISLLCLIGEIVAYIFGLQNYINKIKNNADKE